MSRDNLDTASSECLDNLDTASMLKAGDVFQAHSMLTVNDLT